MTLTKLSSSCLVQFRSEKTKQLSKCVFKWLLGKIPCFFVNQNPLENSTFFSLNPSHSCNPGYFINPQPFHLGEIRRDSFGIRGSFVACTLFLFLTVEGLKHRFFSENILNHLTLLVFFTLTILLKIEAIMVTILIILIATLSTFPTILMTTNLINLQTIYSYQALCVCVCYISYIHWGGGADNFHTQGGQTFLHTGG